MERREQTTDRSLIAGRLIWLAVLLGLAFWLHLRWANILACFVGYLSAYGALEIAGRRWHQRWVRIVAGLAGLGTGLAIAIATMNAAGLDLPHASPAQGIGEALVALMAAGTLRKLPGGRQARGASQVVSGMQFSETARQHIGAADEDARRVYRVRLVAAGRDAILVIKALREVFTLHLKDAKVLSDSAPVELMAGLTLGGAEYVRSKLESAGATIEVEGNDGAHPSDEVG